MYDLIIVWRALDACNLECPFCECSVLHKYPRVYKPNEEEVLRFAGILQQYRGKSGSRILFSWLGGEPLLWQDIFEISSRLKHEFGLHVSTTTNGTQLNREDVRRELARHFDELTISIDGLGSVHDLLRGQDRLFIRVLEGIDALNNEKQRQDSDLKLRVNTILHSKNTFEFEKLCAVLSRHGVTHLTFNPLMGDKDDLFYQEYGLKREHLIALKEIEEKRREIFAKYGLVVCGGHRYFERVGKYMMGITMPVYDCGPGSRVLFVDQHGNIGPCSFVAARTGIRTTDVETVEDLKELPMRFRKFIQENSPQPCQDCHDTNVFGKFEEPQWVFVQPYGQESSQPTKRVTTTTL